MPTKTRSVSIRTPDGVMPAFLAEPDRPGRAPAVVVIMEAFGLVPHIEDVAKRIAGEGYVAIAPDFYYRIPDNKAAYTELPKAIGLMQKVVDAKFTEDVRAALDFLAAQSSVDGARIGVTGFCMGGRLAMLTACALPDRVKAAVPFYGGGISGLTGQFEKLRAPVLLFFGERDAFIPQDQVRAIEAKLKDLGRRHEVKVYPGAQHGFFCNERPEYHEASA
jgi:carboxymethylenebutenolidase